ncbi:MAG: hypothetical protein EXR77_17860 [Myxococcales bacterium]|nr:hypothetical protein [Myxococcales bacterium]
MKSPSLIPVCATLAALSLAMLPLTARADNPPLAEPAGPDDKPMDTSPPVIDPDYALPRSIQPNRIGIHAGLLGPAGALSAAVAYQIDGLIELQGGLTFGDRSAASTSGSVTSSAGISLLTPFFRGRFWIGRRHAPVAEIGVAATMYKVSGHGNDTSNAATLDYTRETTVPMVFVGGGYGFRTDIGFRVTTMIGWMQYFGAASKSSVTTQGAFDAAGREQIKAALDKNSDELHQPSPYLEFACGWVF